jgi:hypothetical protein
VKSKLGLVLAWGAAGHAVLLALLFWLINVPESNAWMIALSLALCLATLFVAATVEGTATAWIVADLDFPRALRRGARALIPFVCGVAVAAACWWAARRIEGWHVGRSGEIDAWMIARFNAANTVWVHRTINAVAFVLRWIVGLALGWSVLAAWARGGVRAIARLTWVRTGLSPQTIALTAIAIVLFVALPWRAAWWRPRGLPATWVEPASAATKLAALYLIVHVGWLLTIVASAAGQRLPPHVSEPAASRTRA